MAQTSRDIQRGLACHVRTCQPWRREGLDRKENNYRHHPGLYAKNVIEVFKDKKGIREGTNAHQRD